MRAIFFDLDGTLLHFTREYRAVLCDAVADVDGAAAGWTAHRCDGEGFGDHRRDGVTPEPHGNRIYFRSPRQSTGNVTRTVRPGNGA